LIVIQSLFTVRKSLKLESWDFLLWKKVLSKPLADLSVHGYKKVYGDYFLILKEFTPECFQPLILPLSLQKYCRKIINTYSGEVPGVRAQALIPGNQYIPRSPL